jgi:hypothetical protein
VSLALAVGAVIASSIIVAAAVHRRTAVAAPSPSVEASAMLAPTPTTTAPMPAQSDSDQPVQTQPTGMEDLDSVGTASSKPQPAQHHNVHHTNHMKHPGEPTIIDKPRF